MWEELKPCPFCGKYPSTFNHNRIMFSRDNVIYSSEESTYSIECLNEKCPENPSVPEAPCEESYGHPTLQDAIKAWNIFVKTCEHNKKELKPCPFCGCEAIYVKNNTVKYNLFYYCECMECEATSSSCEDVDDAINAWNTRANIQETEA